MALQGERSLDRIRLLRGLTADERRAVAGRCRWLSHPPGKLLIEHGSAGSEVLFIVEGRVRVLGASTYAREVVYAEIAAGGQVGDLAAVDGGRRSATVVTVGACLVAALPTAEFRRLLADHASVALALLEDFARMVRAADVRIAEISTMGATERICRELLRSARPGFRPDLLVIDDLPTQELLASVTGTTRETVAKIVAQLAHARVVRRLRRRLEILQPAALYAMAGLEPRPLQHRERPMDLVEDGPRSQRSDL